MGQITSTAWKNTCGPRCQHNFNSGILVNGKTRMAPRPSKTTTAWWRASNSKTRPVAMKCQINTQPPVPKNPGARDSARRSRVACWPSSAIGPCLLLKEMGNLAPLVIFNHEKVHGKHFHIFPSYSTIHAVPTHFLSFLKGWPFPVRAPKDQQVRTCGGFEHIYCLRFVGCFRQSGCIQKTKKKGRRGFAEEHAFWRGSREIEAGL